MPSSSKVTKASRRGLACPCCGDELGHRQLGHVSPAFEFPELGGPPQQGGPMHSRRAHVTTTGPPASAIRPSPLNCGSAAVTSSPAILCSSCVQRAWRGPRQRYQIAWQQWQQARQEAADIFEDPGSDLSHQHHRHPVVSQDAERLRDNSPRRPPWMYPTVLSELQHQRARLQAKVQHLQQQVARRALALGTQQIRQEEEQRQLQEQQQAWQNQHEQLQRLQQLWGTLQSGRSNAPQISDRPPPPPGQEACSREEANLPENRRPHPLMTEALTVARQRVRQCRFQWALAALEMHRLEVEVPELAASNSPLPPRPDSAGDGPPGLTTPAEGGPSPTPRRQARGIGKIGGLPLPHSNDLMGVLPREELQSALRSVATVTHLVARCLGIYLPHPILLALTTPAKMTTTGGTPRHHSSPAEGDIADLTDLGSCYTAPTTTAGTIRHVDEQKEEVPLTRTASLSSSVASLTSQFAKTALGRATGRFLDEAINAQWVAPPLSMDPNLVQQRLLYAQGAVLAERAPAATATHYPLMVPPTAGAAHQAAQEKFAVALQLLQNNVVALCIRAGVPVTDLWPAEAMLLNLHALLMYCQTQTKNGSDETLNKA